MSWSVHEVKHVGFLSLVLHDDGQWGTLKTDLAADLIAPIVRPFVFPVQVPGLATRWCLMSVLNNHVAK